MKPYILVFVLALLLTGFCLVTGDWLAVSGWGLFTIWSGADACRFHLTR